jgi:hypothetical protein
MQVAVGADLNYTASSLQPVGSGVMQGFWDNSVNFISKIYLQPVGIAMRGVALRCTYGAVAVGIGGTTGACVGYHYLSKFLFDQSSYLYRD